MFACKFRGTVQATLQTSVAFLLFVMGCGELAAPREGGGSASITIRASLNRSESAAPLAVVVAVGYQRNAVGSQPSTEIAIGTSTVDVTASQGTVSIPVEVDIGRCLADPYRAATGVICPLMISIALRQGAATADSVHVGPVNAEEDVVATLADPVVLREVAKLQLNWPGSTANSAGDTLRAGKTLALSVVALDVIGASVVGKSVTWESSAPAIAAVNANTGVITGMAPGTAMISAVSAGRTATFAAKVYAAANQIQVVAGDGQRIPSGGAIPVAPTVRVTDLSGRAAEAVTVTFAVTGGNGQLSGGTVRTDSAGLARPGVWTTGNVAAVNTLSASATGASTATITGYGTIPALHDVLAVGQRHGCVIGLNGISKCWGENLFGQLGIGNTIGPSAPVAVSGNLQLVTIKSRGSHTCGQTVQDTVKCWGRNISGSVTGTANPNSMIPTPVTVPTGGQGLSISPALLTTCMLNAANDGLCWGLNQRGEVGDGTLIARNSPTRVSTALKFASIEASWIHSCALTFAGAAYCWGTHSGDVLAGNDLTPVAVNGGHTFVRLYAGGTHTCGIKTFGEAWCWGPNGSGQLGDSTTVIRADPVQVVGGLFFGTMSTSLTPNSPVNHTCGITIMGKAYCWGLNASGQLGDGTLINRLVPTAVASSEMFISIGAGSDMTCALTADRRVFCWGSNGVGQLGSGVAGGISMVPVQVLY